jgi:alpha-tubulin suppressor-like RCC1 family protein
LVVGTDNEVAAGLDSLDINFSSLDPGVFSWREYLKLNPDLPQNWDQAAAQNHWLNWGGIGQARGASFTFIPSAYLYFNPDIGDAFGATNYQAAIDHYVRSGRKEGRTTTPRAQGGIQHTTVRSQQVGTVIVKTSGGNANGQLGNGTTTGSPVPVDISGFPARVTEVVAGAYTSVAVVANGTVWTWGSNQYGARGDGTVGGQDLSPRQVPGLSNIVVPSTKDRHVVAAGLSAVAIVDNSGRVWTWGANWNGQLGNGTTNARYTPGTVKKADGSDLMGIVSISIGQSQMTALDIEGHVWTWGSNQSGALGNNSTADSSYAVQVVGEDYLPLGGISQVVAGGSSFCIALGRNGVVYGWGNNGSGQLGQGPGTASLPFARAIPVPSFIDRIAAGSYHVLAHNRIDEKIYVWGYNGWGQLGLQPGAPATVPWPTTMVVSDATTNITDVAAGSYFSLLIRSNGFGSKIFAVGDNQSGQLGINNYTQQNQPIHTNFAD